MKVCYKPYLMVVIAMMTANTNNAQGPKWVAAEHLDVGFRILLADGSTASIKKMDKEALDVPVFNFSVDGLSNYYVGQTGSLVHNNKKCAWETDPDVAIVRDGPKPLSQKEIDGMSSSENSLYRSAKISAQAYRDNYMAAKNRLLAKKDRYLHEAQEAQNYHLEEGVKMALVGKSTNPHAKIHPIKLHKTDQIQSFILFMKSLKPD